MVVVFDLDGTLIDSVGDLAASASELVTTLGGRPLDRAEVADMVGDGAALLVRRALEAAGLVPDTPGALGLFLEIYDRRLLDTTVPYPGVAETLSALSRRARLAVLTNKPLVFSQRILDAFALSPVFDSVIGGDGPYPRKPNPDGLRAVIGRNVTSVDGGGFTGRPGDGRGRGVRICLGALWVRRGAIRRRRPRDALYVGPCVRSHRGRGSLRSGDVGSLTARLTIRRSVFDSDRTVARAHFDGAAA